MNSWSRDFWCELAEKCLICSSKRRLRTASASCPGWPGSPSAPANAEIGKTGLLVPHSAGPSGLLCGSQSFLVAPVSCKPTSPPQPPPGQGHRQSPERGGTCTGFLYFAEARVHPEQNALPPSVRPCGFWRGQILVLNLIQLWGLSLTIKRGERDIICIINIHLGTKADINLQWKRNVKLIIHFENLKMTTNIIKKRKTRKTP